MTRGYVYDDSSGYVTLALRVLQEEGEYEYAGDKGGSGMDGGDLEEAVLYQPLGDSSSSIGGSKAALTRLSAGCLTQYSGPRGTDLSGRAGCARYVGIFGEIVGGIDKVAKGGWHIVKHAANSVWHWVEKHASLARTIDCNLSGGGAGILAGVGLRPSQRICIFLGRSDLRWRLA
jgi:hypothetical protein